MNIEHSISNYEVFIISTSGRNLKSSVVAKRFLDVSYLFDMTKLSFFKEIEATDNEYAKTDPLLCFLYQERKTLCSIFIFKPTSLPSHGGD